MNLDHPTGSRRGLIVCASLLSLALITVPTQARAQARSRALLGADLEAGAQFILSGLDTRLFGPGVGGAIDFEFNVHPALGIHLGGFGTYFTAGNGASNVSPPTGQPATYFLGGRAGLRAHWSELFPSLRHDLWIDAHAVIGESGGVVRPGFDAGIGANFRLAQNFRVGPFVRYQFSHDPLGDHPMWISVGLEIALFGDPRHIARDTDADGTPDPEDSCPNEPAGAHPDANRPGCPARDSDSDGVFDTEDECPTIPAGARPDPAHRGCPSSDRDNDGVADTVDRCPTEPGPAPTGCPVHDADNDGIADERDACPTTAPGAHPDPERPGCPDGDDDADGVTNHADQCRTEPQGLHPDPARPGCPVADRDHDSVPDTTDACPDRAGAPSRDARRNGCPGLTVIEGEQIRILRPVFFASRRDRILPRSRPVLRAVADALLATPQITRMSIEGHTDDLGDDAQNLILSSRRAANVMAYLISEGVEPPRLTSVGYGETRPLVNAPTADARAVNRRVEFRIAAIDGQPVGGASSASPAPASVSPAPASVSPAPASASPAPANASPAR